MESLIHGVMGATTNYFLANATTFIAEDPNPQVRTDTMAIGFGGGVLGKAMMDYWVPTGSRWYHMVGFTVMGVILFDWALFSI